MGNQRTFASIAWNGKGKVTRRERFLAEMDAVIPWPRLIRLIEPHYPKAGQRYCGARGFTTPIRMIGRILKTKFAPVAGSR